MTLEVYGGIRCPYLPAGQFSVQSRHMRQAVIGPLRSRWHRSGQGRSGVVAAVAANTGMSPKWQLYERESEGLSLLGNPFSPHSMGEQQVSFHKVYGPSAHKEDALIWP
jgi:hypothetical protein